MSFRRFDLEKISAGVFFLLATWVGVSLLRWIWLYWNVLPFWDQWTFLAEYAELRSSLHPRWLEFLLGQHNEHRIFVARLFLIADLEFFGGGNKSLILENLLVQLLTWAALCWLVLAHLRSLFSRIAVLSFAFLVLFSAGQVDNFIWGFQIQFVGVYAAAIFACLSAVRGWNIRAGCFATVATLMMANGVFVWPVLMIIALLQKRSRFVAIAYGAGFLVCLGAYLVGYKSVAGHSSLSYALAHPLQFFEYLLIYLGGFASAGNMNVAIFFGGIELIFLGILVLHAWRRRDFQVREFWAFLGVAAFVLGSALLTTAGRLSFGADQALAGRYVTPSSILLVCVVFGWLCRVRKVEANGFRYIVTPDAYISYFAVLAVAFIGVNHWHHRDDLIGRHQRLNIASDAIAVDARDSRAYGMAFSDMHLITKASDWLKTRNLSIFSTHPWSMLGSKIGVDIPIAPDARCVGNIDVVKPVSSGDGNLATSVRGWGWDRHGQIKPSAVLLVDAANRVTGFASEEVARADVALTLGLSKASMAGWAGFNANGTPVAAYGLIEGATLACKLSRL